MQSAEKILLCCKWSPISTWQSLQQSISYCADSGYRLGLSVWERETHKAQGRFHWIWNWQKSCRVSMVTSRHVSPTYVKGLLIQEKHSLTYWPRTCITMSTRNFTGAEMVAPVIKEHNMKLKLFQPKCGSAWLWRVRPSHTSLILLGKRLRFSCI